MATFTGKEYKVAVGLHTSNLGVATVAGTMYYMRLDSVNDIDWSGGDNNAQLERTGQRVMRPTDYLTAYDDDNAAGGTYSWAWDNYVPENEALFQALMTSVTEQADTTANYTINGNQATNSYADAAANSYDLALQIINPDAAKGRYMYSSIVDSMTLSWDVGTNGGKLTTSGSMFSGYRPIQYDNSGITVDATAAASGGWDQNIFEMDAITIGGNAVICKAFSLTVSNPVSRVGHKVITEASPGSAAVLYGQPDGYARGGQITVEGSMTVKYDSNTRALIDNWLKGTSTAVVFADHASIGSSTCFLMVHTAKLTGYTKDYGGDDGIFIEIPFIGTAEAAAEMVSFRIS